MARNAEQSRLPKTSSSYPERFWRLDFLLCPCTRSGSLSFTVDLQLALERRAQVEEFQRQHRIGLLTLVFTDIVGSTRLKQQWGDAEGVALIQRHHVLVREILSRFKEAQEISTAGDSFFLVFAKPSEAVQFALLLQSRLGTLTQETGRPTSDRIGIHFGEVFIEEAEGWAKPKDLYGLQVDVCARVMSLAQANQILMTRFVFDNARAALRREDLEGTSALSWLNHGPYLLKGIEEPLEICEVGAAGAAPLCAPVTSENARRHVSDESEPVLGWRPALELRVPGTEWILEKKLGEGGFGEVWLGRHEKLKHRRVFKFCFRADRVRSLKREVTLFRVLKERVGHHPNIVGIQEVFFEEPPFYIVMDYAEAQDLKSWSEERGGVERVPLETRLEIVAQVADALQAAHEAGVIHRDVKPSNILVSGGGALECGGSTGSTPLSISDGSGSSHPVRDQRIQSAVKPAHLKVQAKLTDFGIGQVVSQEALAGMTRMGFTQTMLSPGSSSQTGTHLYMAPELLAGKPASTRSDIYSLGVVLYQLLVGDFTHPLTTDWTRKITDPLLREDLEKCFAGDPEERFASAGELATKLRALEKRQSEVAQRQAALAARETAVRRRKKLWQATVGFSIILVMAGILIYAFKQTRPAVPPRKSIVVLPFKNDSPEKADKYLSASLTGEFIDRLKKVSGVKAIRTSELMATNRIEDICNEVANYNVDAVFEGSIQKSGEQLRLTARLVNAAGGQARWSATNSHNRKGVLTLPGDLVREVTTALEIPLTAAERQIINRTPTQNPEAYDAYLHGKFHSSITDEVNNQAAIEMLERAVHLDTNFALAYAELGRAYANRLSVLHPAEKELELKAKTAIDMALSLNPKLADAHLALSYLLWSPSQQFPHERAIQEVQKALESDPQSEDADFWLNLIYHHVGLLEECLQLENRAIAVNPLNPRGTWFKGSAQADLGDYKSALETWGKARGEHWIPALGYWWKASAHFQLGETNEASVIIDKFLEKRPGDYGGLFGSLRAMLYAKAGDVAKAKQEIAKAIEQKEKFLHFHHTAYQIASAYALMNETNNAISWLKETVTNGWNCYPLFLVDHNLKSLMGSQEFKVLLADEEKKYKYYKAEFGVGSLSWDRLQRDRK
jgi:serine/threonine protein kinase/class 3 adenylate cyclase